MKDRIKKIRTDNKLSMEKFGERLRITRSSVCKLEKGENNPSDQTIDLICREFNIREEWLRDGIQPMEKTPDDKYLEIAVLIDKSNDERAKRAIIDYWNLTDSDKELFWKFVDRFVLKKEGD